MKVRFSTITERINAPAVGRLRLGASAREWVRAGFGKPSGATDSKLAFIEGMRGLAALYVVLTHFCSMAAPQLAKGKSEDWVRWLMAPFAYGHLAVAAFIVISGYCLQYSLYRAGDGRLMQPRKFFKRRALRILPAYYACLLLSIATCIWVTSRFEGQKPFDQYLPLTPANVASHFLMIHNLSPTWMYKINGVLWSIAIEAQLYVVFPLIVMGLFRFGRLQTLAIVGAAAWAIAAVFPGGMKLYPWFGFLFVVGMVTASLAFRPHLRAGVIPKGMTGFATVALFATYLLLNLRTANVWPDLSFGLAVAALIYVMTVEPGGALDRFLSWRPLVQLGLFSYSLYLMHHPIQQMLFLWRPAFVQSAPAILAYFIVVGLPVILLGTYGFYRLFEQPFIKSGAAKNRSVDRVVPLALPLRAAKVAHRTSTAE